MPNSLMNALGGMMPQQGSLSDFGQVVQQYQQFKSNFQGDARQQVQNLINSGQITQQQYDALQNVARQFLAVLPR